MRIALISCTKLKQDHSCKAEEMYLPSQLFNKLSKYIKRQNYDGWFILSAKYGLLDPKEVIEPYNVTLNDMNKKEIIEWSKRVDEKLKIVIISEIDFYAGDKYRKFLIPLLEKRHIVCNVPLKGLGIGQQLSWLNKK